MTKWDIHDQFEIQNRIYERQNTIFGPVSCQIRIVNVNNLIFGPSWNDKILFLNDNNRIVSPSQKRICNVKLRYLASILMSNYDIRPQFECQNRICYDKI